ncbi:hypothetical protein ABW21_db0208779 [Orbilia brochopaga]|nr:hypothetical protein ABW21_db0208779 [Drechslerella brochopaga]
MPAQRRTRRGARNRNVRITYCQDGSKYIYLLFRLKEGSHGPTRTYEASAKETLASFVQGIICDESEGDWYPTQPGWTYDMLSRRKSLIRLVEELEEKGEMINVGDMFRGGETIHWRIYDETGQEMEDLTIEDYERRIGGRIKDPARRKLTIKSLEARTAIKLKLPNAHQV